MATFLPYGLFLCVVMFISTSAKIFPKDLSAVKLPHSVVLDEDEKFHLWWDFDEEKVIFEVRVKTLGYVGLGLSPNGGMTGADVIMGGVSDVDGKVFFEDRHATGKWEPISDTSQDWKLITGSQNDTHTVLRFWRKLQTCDKQDRPITADTTRVIWAYKDTDLSESSGSLYHGTHHRGSKSIFLLNPQSVRPEMPKDAITMEFRNNDLMVPANDTVYWCQAFSTHQFSTKHHAIKFEPVISKGNEGVVHHFVLYACPLETTNETAGITGRCYDTSVPVEWRRCLTSIYAWAIGGGPFYLPEHVGYPFGSEGDPKLVLLETHFDNPDKRSDVVDSSGLRLTLTPSLRQHDAGTLVVGMTSSPSQVIPPFADDFRIDGHCVPECLAKGMAPRSSIKVFAGFLHAHLLGVAIKFRHFRKGVELQPIIKDDNYDFNFQETRMLQKEVEIQAGDHLISECHYSSIHRNKVTFGGFSTRDEMCETFALYYPKISLAGATQGLTATLRPTLPMSPFLLTTRFETQRIPRRKP
ncbi:DBH-like monooxygenase protein 1 homolog [Liolophura sinensis]|uniref:DBH-like monooxygenase protein 1 homolog n=1 Tax=Liolophura sinensis TaxID=3198878 RepID=UPI0031594AEB